MKLLGIDYGRRRIGVAVTDSSGQHIRGLTTIDRKKHPDPLIPLISIISQENPDILILGLPLDINDAETVMSKEVRSFAQNLRERSGLPIDFADESYSSRRASSLMMFRKKTERRDKAAIDRLAACLILEVYREDHA